MYESQDAHVSRQPYVSIVIPTYNRRESLEIALSSIANQSYSRERFEVIVVDDGSSDNTHELAICQYPFPLRYLRQANQGDSAARNTGAIASQADLLLFLDDDVVIEPVYLSSIINTYINSKHKDVIVVGVVRPWVASQPSLFQLIIAEDVPTMPTKDSYVDFLQVFSYNMLIGRESYFRIGMMKNLGYSAPDTWCDVDFAYRADQLGFIFLRSAAAVCSHRDYGTISLSAFCSRSYKVAGRAVVLFQKHPSLQSYMNMFRDKTPIMLGQDPLWLVTRKLIRKLMSSQITLHTLEKVAVILEHRKLTRNGLRRIYRWIVSAYLFQGYRQGLRQYGSVLEPHQEV